MSGKSISELLKKGENYLESIKVEVAHKLTKCKCPVISADVEAIKRHSDMKELRENGVVIFIDNKSPLKDEKNETYRSCCDLHLINDNNIDDIVYYICFLWA